MSLEPEHVSAYELVLEEGARLYGPARSGPLAMPDDDAAADLYERAIEVLADAGYTHYEVSNWARGKAADGAEVPARACRHNVQTWRGGAYVGLGPGAHSHRSAPVEVRYANVDDIGAYVDRLASGLSPVAWQEAIDSRTAMAETMMLGLRLLGEGVPRRRFAERHHMPLEAAFGPELETLVSDSLVRLDATRCRLTHRGLMVANRVFAAFMA
jgi:oxygen-independent coproporphyrinogen-3 oxidase